MFFIWAGIAVTVGGWLFLTTGVTIRVGAYGDFGAREVANVHLIAMANNVILGGYAMIIAGVVLEAVERLKSYLVESAPLHMTHAPNPYSEPAEAYTPRGDRQRVREVVVDGIPGTLFSDHSIDVLTANGVTHYKDGEELRRAYSGAPT